MNGMDYSKMLKTIYNSGYDGIDTWIPESLQEKHSLFNFVEQNGLELITHQHKAEGSTFERFKQSFLCELHKCAELKPLLINSHTGRDFFTTDQNRQLIDIALEFTHKTGILIAHETHRGRMLYSPQAFAELTEIVNEFPVTADFSHWVCVTESMLENFTSIVDKAITATVHIHARIGFEEGPQVPDPRANEWRYALIQFLQWWDKILTIKAEADIPVFTITTEFGPFPYMINSPVNKMPFTYQQEINLYMKELLANRYQQYRLG